MHDPRTDEDEQTVRYYVGSWRAALRAIRDWSEDEISTWITQTLAFYSGRRREQMLHDDPMSYIAPLLVPNDLRQRLDGREFLRLVKALKAVLEQGDPTRDFTDVNAFQGLGSKVMALLDSSRMRM